MMQDYIRTGTYQKAMLQNFVDFRDKVADVSRDFLFIKYFRLYWMWVLVVASFHSLQCKPGLRKFMLLRPHQWHSIQKNWWHAHHMQEE